jgi:hypothetical protein
MGQETEELLWVVGRDSFAACQSTILGAGGLLSRISSSDAKGNLQIVDAKCLEVTATTNAVCVGCSHGPPVNQCDGSGDVHHAALVEV